MSFSHRRKKQGRKETAKGGEEETYRKREREREREKERERKEEVGAGIYF